MLFNVYILLLAFGRRVYRTADIIIVLILIRRGERAANPSELNVRVEGRKKKRN